MACIDSSPTLDLRAADTIGVCPSNDRKKGLLMSVANANRSWFSSSRMLSMVLITCAVAARPCQAAIVTYDFTGVIDISAVGSLPSDVHLGSAFTGSFSFDTSTPGTVNSSSQVLYQGALTNLSVKVGSSIYDKALVDSTPHPLFPPVNAIEVDNNTIGLIDQYLLTDSVTDTSHVSTALELRLNTIDVDPTAVTTTHLGGDILDLSKFQTHQIEFAVSNPDRTFAQEFSGNITSLTLHAGNPSPVPEPGSIALLGIGSLGLLCGARRRKKNVVRLA